MPKRKAKPTDDSEGSPVAKISKKGAAQRRKNHGGKKSPTKSVNSKAKGITVGVSSNWRALSQTLGVPPGRKREQSSSHHNKAGDWKEKRGKSGRQAGEETAGEKELDIWFDDVPLERVNGEPVPKVIKRDSSLITGLDKSAGKHVALDCEMVGTGPDGSYSMLARACIVNHHGHTLYDSFVAPMDKITDYRTNVSGVSPKDLHGAPEFRVVQKEISNLLKDRILIGHSVKNDLKALLLSHPKKDTRDTSKYRVFKTVAKTRYPSLKGLAKEILGIDIQTSAHNPVEDARVAMKLYQLHRKEWELSIRERLTRCQIRERRREKRRKESTKGGFQRPLKTCEPKPFNIMLHTDR